MISARRTLFAGQDNDIQHRNGWRDRRRPDGRWHRRGRRPGGTDRHAYRRRRGAGQRGSRDHQRSSVAPGGQRADRRGGSAGRSSTASRWPRPSTGSATAISWSRPPPKNEEVKRKIFIALRAFLKPDAIVASNTSSISITRLASVTAEPRAFHRHPFHKSGAAHAARRADPRHRHQGRDIRGREGTSSPGSARRRRCRRISPPSSSTASCCR